MTYLTAIDACFALTELFSKCHHAKRCSEASFKFHVNNLKWKKNILTYNIFSSAWLKYTEVLWTDNQFEG